MIKSAFFTIGILVVVASLLYGAYALVTALGNPAPPIGDPSLKPLLFGLIIGGILIVSAIFIP